MDLSALSISELVEQVTGDGGVDYLSGKKLAQLFNELGSRDDYDSLIEDKTFNSRSNYTKRKLMEINGTMHIKNLLETLVDDRRCSNPDLKAENINEIIKHDGLYLEKDAKGIYRILGKDFAEELKFTPVFEDIEQQIIGHINSAQYLIWVAVAWITSRPIAEALYRQYQKGVNVRIVVNDDDLTLSKGAKFENTEIEYYKISPQNQNFKNIMHHKFCVIDLNKVISGSFNWTTKASFNNENISVIEQRDQAEKFANEFLRLISD
ncbi:phospholipase D-like domain-containing protein [Acinetobacter dispersus]|uniref:phospholipase D-like domain-containing protein n=1 Tax=Acinetobacter dispersus TaxID=70348 RepID=UPI001F4B7B56|nr:phospholipase D-like domain-containing protein [Acinetobacter dispersus]MCH7394124.1 phospholipase D-like domain-containing protein [Acinetobacter dispersus]